MQCVIFGLCSKTGLTKPDCGPNCEWSQTLDLFFNMSTPLLASHNAPSLDVRLSFCCMFLLHLKLDRQLQALSGITNCCMLTGICFSTWWDRSNSGRAIKVLQMTQPWLQWPPLNSPLPWEDHGGLDGAIHVVIPSYDGEPSVMNRGSRWRHTGRELKEFAGNGRVSWDQASLFPYWGRRRREGWRLQWWKWYNTPCVISLPWHELCTPCS